MTYSCNCPDLCDLHTPPLTRDLTVDRFIFGTRSYDMAVGANIRLVKEGGIPSSVQIQGHKYFVLVDDPANQNKARILLGVKPTFLTGRNSP